MNPQIEFNLALILFLPWFAILAALYWIYPRQPRTSARRLFDTTALVVATVLAAWGMHWSMVHADPNAGAIWKQVLASSISYGLFLLVMTIALIVRFRMFRTHPASCIAVNPPMQPLSPITATSMPTRLNASSLPEHS